MDIEQEQTKKTEGGKENNIGIELRLLHNFVSLAFSVTSFFRTISLRVLGVLCGYLALYNYPRDCRFSKYSVSARSNGMLVSSGT
jgi:hypothetical protein